MKKIILAMILSVSLTSLCMAGTRVNVRVNTGRSACAGGTCSPIQTEVVKKSTKTVKVEKTVKKSVETTVDNRGVVRPLRWLRNNRWNFRNVRVSVRVNN
jgi:hypothetical protein